MAFTIKCRNTGFITIGTSAETPAFVAQCLLRWWNYRGRYDYSGADEILLLMDAGGANAARSVQFKHELLKLSAHLGLRIRVAHYPPYCSKWDPIEHQLFPHVTRSLQGVYLESAEAACRYINHRCTTSTGLVTRAYVLNKEFKLGVKETLPLPDSFPLERHEILPELKLHLPSIELLRTSQLISEAFLTAHTERAILGRMVHLPLGRNRRNFKK